MTKINNLKLFSTLLTVILLFSSSAYSQGVTGDTEVTTGETKVYNYTGSCDPIWTVKWFCDGGTITSADDNCSSVTVKWLAEGTGMIRIQVDNFHNPNNITQVYPLFVNVQERKIWYESSTNNNIYYDLGGNVGIGTAKPQGKLHILHKTAQKGLLLGYYGNDIQGRYGSTGQYNGDLILNKWAGNVGIGTTTPSSKLEIHDGNQTIKFLTGTCTSGYTMSVGVNNDGINFSNNSSIRGFNFSNAARQIMTLSAYGRVGIGTTSPTSKLTVNGKITCEEVEVKSVAADFVFKSDYKLRSLEEVESFIADNGHLPDVAPASETVNGVELSKFNTLLLQKIEELTLYTIEQQKLVDQLTNKVQQLENK